MDKHTENRDQDEQPDQYHGYGGSYIIDSVTGQRRPYNENEHLLIVPNNPTHSIIEQHTDTVTQIADQINEIEIDPVMPVELVDRADIGSDVEIVEQLESETNNELDLIKPAPRKKKSKLGDE